MIKTRFIVAIGLLMTLACCSNSGTDQTPDPNPPTPPTPPATGDYVSVQNGKIYAPNGGELSLWGVNFQPCLSWEYNDRLKRHGIPQTAEALRRVAENNLEEVTKLKVSVIRCPLTPADFTDAEGNLVETPYLDVLDYMVAEAAERGIYITLALINHMGSGYVPNSVFMTAARQEWVHDKEVVRKSKNYVRQLLTRKNNYSGTTYAAEKHIALWELINEPEAFSYTDIQSNPAAYADFQSWAAGNGQQDNDASYALFRQELIRDYIDGMYDVIREAGAQQPVVWSHNWHRYRNGNPDIFKGALASKAEAVACCNYPGQDLVPQDYWSNPKDLTSQDYSGWFNQYFDDVNGYGWMTLPEYAGKAKTVYEFETFFNQSAYLYPIQAQYFRALGVQCASMWTYTMQEYAPYHCGSHFLSLTCTPKKAASFIVAGEIYKSTPLGQMYDRLVNEQLGSNFAISKSRDVSIFSSPEKFYHSGDVTQWCPLNVSDGVRSIVGVGSSPLVTYTGTGIYFIDERDGELFVTLEPNHRWLREPWDSRLQTKVSALDYDTPNTMSIGLKAWKEGKYTLYRISDGRRQKAGVLDGLGGMSLTPGDYVIVRGEE